MSVIETENGVDLLTRNSSDTLLGLMMLYGQTTTTGRGITNPAGLLGLTVDDDTYPRTWGVTAARVVKTDCDVPIVSAYLYNSDEVDKNVGLYIVLHELGVEAVVQQARMRVEQLIQKDPAIAARFAAFRSLEEQSTVRVFEQSIWILSVDAQGGEISRSSFADWLVPYVLNDVLRLDVITEFTAEGYEEFLKLKDPVAVAWRTAESANVIRWAERLAKKANVTLQAVYNRQAAWRKEYGIAIDLPNALYRDAIYFGATSVSRPKDRAATLAARSHRDGDERLRLRIEGTMRSDRLRRDGVGALIRAPLRLMPVKVGLINPTAPVTGLAAPSASGTAPPEPNAYPT